MNGLILPSKSNTGCGSSYLRGFMIFLCWMHGFITTPWLLWASQVKNPPVTQKTSVLFLGWEDPLGKGETTHSSVSGFPGGSAGKESTCNVGNPSLIPGLGRSPGEGNSYPLQCPGMENPKDWDPWGHKESETSEWFHFHDFYDQCFISNCNKNKLFQ